MLPITRTTNAKAMVNIPKEARQLIGLKPGQDVVITYFNGSLRFRKKRNIQELAGVLKEKVKNPIDTDSDEVKKIIAEEVADRYKQQLENGDFDL